MVDSSDSMDSALTPEGRRQTGYCVCIKVVVYKYSYVVASFPGHMECGLGMRVSYIIHIHIGGGCVVGVYNSDVSCGFDWKVILKLITMFVTLLHMNSISHHTC